MTYTFECGVCHAVYRLDEEQITGKGVKVTCPRCLNYFFLRPGSAATEVPVIEHIVSDGEQEIEIPPPSPGEATSDQLLSDDDLAATSLPPEEEKTLIAPGIPPAPAQKNISEPPVPDKVRPTRGGFPTPSDTQITKADLNDYPPDEPPRSAIDQILIPFSLIVLVVSGLLYMNYRNLIRIPGLELLQEGSQKLPASNGLPGVDTARNPEAPKHGFPVIDPGVNAWDSNPPAIPSTTARPEE